MLIYANPAIVQLPLGVPEGLTLSSPSVGQVEIAAGRALIRRALGLAQLAIQASTLRKNLTQSWVQGNNGNGLPGSVGLAANTIYHVFLIMDASGTVDAYFDTSALAANRPSGWDARMIGSIMTSGVAGIIEFDQQDDRFEYRVDMGTADTTNLSTFSSNIVTLPTPSIASAFGTVVTFVASTAITVFLSAETSPISGSWANAITNTYLQLYWQISGNRMRLFSNGTNVTVALRVRGFIHPRGSQG